MIEKMKKTISLLILILIPVFGFAQPSDTLITIDGHVVDSEEFMRIYNKNSNIAEENQKSIDEYLDLFINYKLKVVEAENLGYDTVTSFIQEMESYTHQLAKPYLEKNQSLDSFVMEAYERQQEEVNASHILLKINKNSLPADTARVYNRIIALREQILAGKDWDQVIKDESRDPDNPIGGDLGWFSVFRMVYPFETAAYQTPVGEISMPVRTDYGYHLIKVNGRRPSKGEVKGAHIMTILPRNPNEVEKEAAWDKINKAYAALEAGADWDSVALEYSEHKSTYKRGGSMGYIRTGSAPDTLLETLFSLDTFEYSQPFPTQYGFHIVMPEAFKPNPPFEEVEADIRAKVRSTGDILRITEEQMMNNIKEEYGFAFNEEKLDTLYKLMDTTMYSGTWDPGVAAGLSDTVFFIGDTVYTQYDVAKFFAQRRVAVRVMALDMTMRARFLRMMDDKIVEYERIRLPQKYPEYKNLLQEYHDGILLFNLTEDKVWRKAVEDSAGLKTFYDTLAEKYMWEQRIAISKYTYADSSITDVLLPLAQKRAKSGLNASAISKIVCPEDSVPCITLTELKYERGDNAVADSITWKKKQYLISRDNQNIVLYVVDAILKPVEKTLEDARGLYTADYQTHLEDKWVADLRAKYEITVNRELLEELKSQE